jgi:glycosyltransferase involved in cell wall biosynthesis
MGEATSGMSKTLDVSVVISTYNRAEVLPGALEGLLQQQAPGVRHEVVVVANNSTDSTRVVVESFTDTRGLKTRVEPEERELTLARAKIGELMMRLELAEHLIEKKSRTSGGNPGDEGHGQSEHARALPADDALPGVAGGPLERVRRGRAPRGGAGPEQGRTEDRRERRRGARRDPRRLAGDTPLRAFRRASRSSRARYAVHPSRRAHASSTAGGPSPEHALAEIAREAGAVRRRCRAGG